MSSISGSKEDYDSDLEKLVGGAHLSSSNQNTDQMKIKQENETEYQKDIQALRRRLDFLEMSRGSTGSSDSTKHRHKKSCTKEAQIRD